MEKSFKLNHGIAIIKRKILGHKTVQLHFQTHLKPTIPENHVQSVRSSPWLETMETYAYICKKPLVPRVRVSICIWSHLQVQSGAESSRIKEISLVLWDILICVLVFQCCHNRKTSIFDVLN